MIALLSPLFWHGPVSDSFHFYWVHGDLVLGNDKPFDLLAFELTLLCLQE
jgi:hypothetical protein